MVYYQAKEKQRRLRQREERMIEQKKNQEERIRKALERAQAAPKKIVCISSFFAFIFYFNDLSSSSWFSHIYPKIIQLSKIIESFFYFFKHDCSDSSGQRVFNSTKV
jgi:hypothetical protein